MGSGAQAIVPLVCESGPNPSTMSMEIYNITFNTYKHSCLLFESYE